MGTETKVVVYGGGYTGKLCAEYLAQREIPFYLVGRTQEKLEKALAVVEERFGRPFEAEIKLAQNTVEDLTAAFQGIEVVINTVGPFMQLGEPVVQACLAAGCHYVDTTGETDWAVFTEKNYGKAFEEKELLLSPANSFMWVAGALAAEVVLETEGVDTLDITYDIINALPSVGSTRSFLRMVSEPQYYLEANELKEWPKDEMFTVALPHRNRPILTLPWSGACEPIWYRDDERVLGCRVLTGFGDEMIKNVHGMILNILENTEGKSEEEKEAFTNTLGDEVSVGEPEKDHMDVQRSYIVCHGTGRQVTTSFTLSLAAPYQWTGQVSAEAAERILNGQLKQVGFKSGAAAFGHRELLKRFHALGYTNNPYA